MPQEQSYRQIPLSKGQIARVSPQDYEWLAELRWSALWNKYTKNYYAVHLVWIPEAQTTQTFYMQRMILGLERGDKRQADHIDRNTLNNTRENLRIATQQQNAMNAKLRTDNTSGFKGVFYDKRRGRWFAAIRIDGRNKHLGRFSSPKEASERYNEVALSLYGHFFRLS